MRHDHVNESSRLAYSIGVQPVLLLSGLVVFPPGLLALHGGLVCAMEGQEPVRVVLFYMLAGGLLAGIGGFFLFWRWGFEFNRKTRTITWWYGFLFPMYVYSRPYPNNTDLLVHVLPRRVVRREGSGYVYTLVLRAHEKEILLGTARNAWGFSTQREAEKMAQEISAFLADRTASRP